MCAHAVLGSPQILRGYISKPDWTALFALGEGYMIYVPWDSSLVWHLLTFWQPAWQPIASRRVCFSRGRMPDLIGRPPAYQSDMLTIRLPLPASYQTTITSIKLTASKSNVEQLLLWIHAIRLNLPKNRNNSLFKFSSTVLSLFYHCFIIIVDLCCQMQTLSMNTITYCHKTHHWSLMQTQKQTLSVNTA